MDGLCAPWAGAAPDPGTPAGEIPEAATAVLLAPGPGGSADPLLLLILRATHPQDPWSGQVGLPGGRRDPIDADRLATALRETREEIGLDVPRESAAGALDPIRALRRGVRQDLIVHPFVFRLPEAAPPGRSVEVQEARWIPVAHLLDPARATEVDVPGGSRGVPAVSLDGWLLWGLTYRMLTDLFARSGRTLAAGPPTARG
ncbi:MAG: coenzyme A pyrophosphatase [Planctomycetes bacterium]|nr:coenzyme A pyrophosphatase [Planctomycetota bacterium]